MSLQRLVHQFGISVIPRGHPLDSQCRNDWVLWLQFVFWPVGCYCLHWLEELFGLWCVVIVLNSPDYSAIKSSYIDSHRERERERKLALAQWFTVLSGTSTRTAWSLKMEGNKPLPSWHHLGFWRFSVLIVGRFNILRSGAHLTQSNLIQCANVFQDWEILFFFFFFHWSGPLQASCPHHLSEQLHNICIIDNRKR